MPILEQIYDNASKYYSLPSYEQFKIDMQDPDKREEVRKSMSRYYTVPESTKFSQDILGALEEPEKRVEPEKRARDLPLVDVSPEIKLKPPRTWVQATEDFFEDPLTADLMRSIFGEKKEGKTFRQGVENFARGLIGIVDLPGHIAQTLRENPVKGVPMVLYEFADFAAVTTNNIILATSPTATNRQKQDAIDNLYEDPAAPLFLGLMTKGGLGKAKKWAEMSKADKKALIKKADPGVAKKVKEWSEEKTGEPTKARMERVKEIRGKPLDIKESAEHRIQVINEELTNINSTLGHRYIPEKVRAELLRKKNAYENELRSIQAKETTETGQIRIKYAKTTQPSPEKPAPDLTTTKAKSTDLLIEKAKKYDSAEEFVESQRKNKIIDGKLEGEDIARANPDGTITVDKDKFYSHSKADQLDILEHEYAHFIEAEIIPEFKAKLFDNSEVVNYRGRNINEKLANMIQDGKLPKVVTDKFPNLPKTKQQLTDIWNQAQGKAKPGKSAQVSKDKTIQDAYEQVLRELPEHISKDITIEKISVGKFPAENKGEGGRFEIGAKDKHYITIEKGETNLVETLKHEMLHSYVWNHNELTRGKGYFGHENAIKKLEAEIKKTKPEKPKVTGKDRIGKKTYIKYSDGTIIARFKGVEFEVSPEQYQKALNRSNAQRLAANKRLADKIFIPERMLDEMPALRLIRGINVGKDYPYALEGVVIGKNPVAAKPALKYGGKADYDLIEPGDLGGELARYADSRGFPDFDKLLEVAENEVLRRGESQKLRGREYEEQADYLEQEAENRGLLDRPFETKEEKAVFEQALREDMKEKDLFAELDKIIEEQHHEDIKNYARDQEAATGETINKAAKDQTVAEESKIERKPEEGSLDLRRTPTSEDKFRKDLTSKDKETAQEIDKFYENSEKQFKEANKIKLSELKEKTATKVVDVSANVKRELLKKGGAEGKRAVIRLDLSRGAGAKATEILNDANVYKGLSKYEHTLLDRIIRTRSNISTAEAKEGIKNPGGFTPQEFDTYIKSLDPQIKKKLNARADEYFSVMRKQLGELKDEGLISKEVYDKLKNREYERREFIQHIDPEKTFNFGGRKVTVRSSGLKSLSEGSEKAINMDSKTIMADVVSRTQARIAKNKANKALYELADKKPDNGVVQVAKVVKVKDGKVKYQVAPKGMETIEVMIDGQPKPMFMPRELAKEWVLSNPEINSSLANVLGWASGSKVLKPMATGINPEFALTNFPRDIMHAWLVTGEYSNHAPKFLAQMTRDLGSVAKDAWLRKNRWRRYIDEGGGMEFLTHQGQEVFRVKSSTRTPKSVINTMGAVKDYLGYLGETSEMWVRLAIRERALRNGKTPIEATWEARNYLDFAQGGSWAKAADTSIPYLNAGIQGTRGIFRAAKNDPKGFMTKTAWLGTISTGLYLANHYVNRETYDNISDWQKTNNFIITTPWEKIDKEGNRRGYYFAIPKDQGQRGMTAMFDALMEKQFEGKFPSERVFEAFTELSPVMPGDMLPPTLDAIYGYLNNRDFWRREDIWKGTDVEASAEYYPGYTHPFWVGLGKANISPLRMEYAASQMFTRGNVYTSMVGGAYKALTNNLDDNKKREINDFALERLPFSRKYLKLTWPEDRTEEIKKKEKELNSMRIKNNRKLDKLYGDNDAIRKFLGTVDEVEYKRLRRRHDSKQKIENIKTNRRFWLQLLNTNPEIRANVFYSEWVNSDEARKKELMRQAGQIKGFATDRFRKEFGVLVNKPLR